MATRLSSGSPSWSLLGCVVVLCVLLSAAVGGVAAAHLDPRFEASVPEPVLQPGTTADVTILLGNDARDPEDSVRTARDLRVEVRSAGPVEVRSGPRFVDRLADGERVPVTVSVRVPADAAAGTYDLPVRVGYVLDDDRKTARLRVPVRVDERARLRIVASDSQVTAGDDGTSTVTVENVGSATAREARLELTSTDPDLTLGGGPVAARSLGTLGPGERRTVVFRIESSETVTDESYAFDAAATYENADGAVVSEALGTVAVTPSSGPAFALRDLSATLRVGEEGVIAAHVVNTGGTPARDAVVLVETSARGVTLTESVVPLGTLDPGEGVDVSIPATVDPDGDGGERAVTLTVEYLTDDGDVRRGDPLRSSLTVAPERDRFRVEPRSARVAVDDSGRLALAVTNVGDEALTDVDARLTLGPPLTSGSPESFVPRIEPGETVTVAFHVEASEDAVATTVAVRLNLSAETESGRTVRQTGPVAVEVFEPTGPETETSVLAAGVVVVLLALLTGWWWLRQ